MFEQATVTYVKDVVGILSGAATLAGIIVGAILAWRRWGREAPQAARGDLSHKISQHLLGSSQRLVHVTLTVKNTGTITLRPKEVYTLIQQVDPLEGDFRQRLLGGKEPLFVGPPCTHSLRRYNAFHGGSGCEQGGAPASGNGKLLHRLCRTRQGQGER